ncbi:hypothetical protein [Moorena sp. SIO3H5]|uniref:hypothetical protein n=1 Tax=Moorena sp. SIO3H5 TaxID=2607834 RepID=UPI0013B877F5|nr:hypothetical protein [Moorena sp. SIO3H5]NEO68656.1 hypothetical protein [Moorena sp. SIO3H5]
MKQLCRSSGVMGGATVDTQRLRLNSETNYTGYIFIVLIQNASGGFPQDRNGAFSVGELNSPRVAPEASLVNTQQSSKLYRLHRH